MWTTEQREKYKGDDRRYPSDLTDAEWGTAAPLFPVYRTATADLREMVNACLYLQRTGCQWRCLPRDFGPWETVRYWHGRFRADGIWSDLSSPLIRAVRPKLGRPSPRRPSWIRRAWCPVRGRGRGGWMATKKSRESRGMS